MPVVSRNMSIDWVVFDYQARFKLTAGQCAFFKRQVDYFISVTKSGEQTEKIENYCYSSPHQ